jgi:hypothetical protein
MSLVPLIRGEGAGPEVALVENMLFSEERVGVRTRDRKYVRWASGKEEVYDLLRDPREQRDLAGVEATVAPLRRLYAQLDLERASARVATVPALNAKTRSAMRALGYLQ